jgi:integrase
MTDLGLAGEVQLSDRTLLRRDGGDSDPCTLIDRPDRPRGLDRHATTRLINRAAIAAGLPHIHPHQHRQTRPITQV